jgi:hypothetical protein
LPVVTINELSPNASDGGLAAAAIEAPLAGEGSETFSFNVIGWVAPREVAVEKFQVLWGSRVVAEVPPNRATTRSGEGLPEVEGTPAVGFEVLVRVIELEPSFEVDVVARLGDGTTCHLGSIRGERELLAVPREVAGAVDELPPLGDRLSAARLRAPGGDLLDHRDAGDVRAEELPASDSHRALGRAPVVARRRSIRPAGAG